MHTSAAYASQALAGTTTTAYRQHLPGAQTMTTTSARRQAEISSAPSLSRWIMDLVCIQLASVNEVVSDPRQEVVDESSGSTLKRVSRAITEGQE
ncbi:hypothetical protein A4X13_0g7338 [Tilletia indica]|uniref:Uncharacterized protein n=1 Tax=Tilletia indica TaxID=43049 RepID=A0A8T8SKL4_9BASI|nr:hypothetical protein A4X13_0g7338 [Tilletia indica]